MKRHSAILLLTASLLASVEPAESSETALDLEIACNRAVLDVAWTLFEDAEHEMGRTERAAFVIRNPSGGFSFQRWPFDPMAYQASYHGVIPDGTVAIIHTHPRGRVYPSANDQVAAARTGFPVYVLTRWRITKTDGESMETVWLGNWAMRLTKRSAHSPCVDGRLSAP